MRLAHKVRALLAGTNGDPRAIVQAAVTVPAADPLRWLMAQNAGTRIYWASRGDVGAAAGYGQAAAAFAPAPATRVQLARQLGPMLAACSSRVRFYGGLRFEQVPAYEQKWRSFGAHWFVLPRFELRTHAHGATLLCNLIPARDRARQNEILSRVASLKEPRGGTIDPFPVPVARRNRPARSDWHAIVEWALRSFEGSALAKVVFAREASFVFDNPLRPLALLEHLAAGTPNCFHYLFQPRGGPAFVGASPERLFRRKGVAVESEAVAGTRPRGASPIDDARLLDELLHSEKERREHEYVRVSLREELSPLVEAFTLDAQPSEMKLANGWHLVSRVRATLRPKITSLDVLGALHPTPAVGGYPTRPALNAIQEHEPFDRGWYAGPVGWIGPNQADFAVAIRSGLVDGPRLSLYSGAGIVTGSTPWAEWDEIEHKLQAFTRILGIAPVHSPIPAAHRADAVASVAG